MFLKIISKLFFFFFPVVELSLLENLKNPPYHQQKPAIYKFKILKPFLWYSN